MVDRRNSTRRQLNRLAHLLRRVNGELGDDEITASGDRTFAVGDRVTARAPNRDLHVDGDRHAVRPQRRARHHRRRPRRPTRPRPATRSPSTSTASAASTSPAASSTTTAPRPGDPKSASTTPTPLTSYAVQGSTRDVSTSRVDATATRAETYVDITRGRHDNHLYLTAATDPLDGEALPRVPPAPADVAVAERLHRSTGEITAWELAHPADEAAPAERAIGI